MKNKIVTSIYSNLHGTDLGGRHSRGGHYKYSLLTLMNMSDADFVCYTSEDEYEDLCAFYYNEKNVDINKLKIKIFDLRNFYFTEKINKIKNIEETKKSDRCVEIQYSKFIWALDEANIDDYDNIFWFDAGLSHTGLFPSKYMIQGDYWSTYYNCKLFNNTFLKNLIEFSGNKIFLCAKENLSNFWSHTLPAKYYKDYSMDHHIIGGFFGGKKNNVINYCNIFLDNTNQILDNEDKIYFEENIMSLIFYNHNELFQPKFFDIWWHEDEKVSGLDMIEYTKSRKSFYKIIEELNG